MKTLRPAVLVTGLLLTLATTASAREPDADGRSRAAEEFRAGQSAFRQQDFTGAAEHFERAAAILPHAATLLNAAEARESAGEFARAAELCDQVLAAAET